MSAVEFNDTSDSLVNRNEISDFHALDSEIQNFNQTKELRLTKDYCNYDGSYEGGISVTIDDLVIDGQGHTIDANKKTRVFNINANNVVLKNIVIKSAYQDGYGGAIYWQGLNGQIINSSFKDCNSTRSGGGVFFKNTATVSNSIFENNQAFFGGAVDFEDDGSISNSKFINNFATFLGGAVYCLDLTTIEDSDFIQNIAGDGAGVYFYQKAFVRNTLFTKNYAIGYGGALTSEDLVEISNSQFIDNYGKFAGAIYFKGQGLVEDSIFKNNNASIAGAIMASGDVVINQSFFISNSALNEGGAVRCDSKNINITNAEFRLNNAKTGNSLYISSNNVKIENITFNNLVSTYETEVYLNSNNAVINNLSFNNVTLIVENTTPSKINTSVSKDMNKIKTVIKAKSKTFRFSKKVKKYGVVLKTVNKKVISKKKLKLKIRGKTYIAKTNSKGMAVFKIKLSKKGKFKTKITFAGDKKYKSSKKIITIKIK